jgi:hypothetical protein
MMEEQRSFRLSTNPARAFADNTGGGEYNLEDEWTDYVVNGQLQPKMAMFLQSVVDPTDYPIILESILKAAKAEEE